MRGPTSLTQGLRTPCLPAPQHPPWTGPQAPAPPSLPRSGQWSLSLPSVFIKTQLRPASSRKPPHPGHLQSGPGHPCPHAGPLKVCPKLMPQGEEGRHPEQHHRLHLGMLRPRRPHTLSSVPPTAPLAFGGVGGCCRKPRRLRGAPSDPGAGLGAPSPASSAASAVPPEESLHSLSH